MKLIEIKEIIKKEIESNKRLQIEILNINSKEIFGEIKEQILLNYISNDVLYIKVKNSTLKHYIYTKKNNFLEKINKCVNFIIEDIQVDVK